jgi:thiamine-monophosphate kinase
MGRRRRGSGGDERAFTAGLARFFGGGAEIPVGIGDDAAVVCNRGSTSVVCCDPVVEGVHFAAGTPLALVGRKAVNRNLADLAAMGAVPDWLLVSLVLPRGLGGAQRTALLRGVRAAARAAGAAVVGGDVATSRGPLTVTVTAIGHLRQRALLRSGARAGDTIHVTGALGGSLAGHHLRFRPPLREGEWLARQRAVHAAIDVSDGLLLDLATLLAASGGLGAEIDAAAVPIARAARRRARGDAAAALRAALGDGEDHVLLWTQAAGTRLARGGPLPAAALAPLGRVLATPGLWLLENGRRRRVAALGYRHELGSVRDRPAR